MKKNLSNEIRRCQMGAARNPYQGSDKRVLFVCSMGILRSATAARLYAQKYNTRACGTYDDALIQISPMLLAWADEVVFVNEANYNHVKNAYDGEEFHHNIKVLDIPDMYEHMHPELIKAFEEQYEPR